MDRRGRDGGGVNKLGLKIILCIAFLSFNLLTGAESPVSEKQERINNVEYNETLKYQTTFLRKPPCCPLGRVTRIDYPEHPISHGRMRACYEYGSAGYISGISVQVNTNGIFPGFCNKDIVENITYNEFGQTSSLTLGNGITTSYGYDVKGRMVRLNSSGDVGGSNKVLQDVLYAFNPNNNITNIANNTTDFNTQYVYGYDGLGRLTSANGSYLGIADGNLSRRFQQSFVYAKNGNLSSKRFHDPVSGSITDVWSYQYTNHQVTNIDSSRSGADTLTMSYDANGNLTRQRDNVKDLTKRISIDSQDRITQIQDGNNAILGSYWYDESGFRIRKSSLEPKNNVFSNVEILYPSKFFGLEFIESENVISSVNNVYLNGVRIAALNEAGALAYYLTDQVDSVSTVLDDEGNTLSLMQYLPYGETFVQRGDLNFSPKFNSQELDRESGFYFFNARFYDPGIARFTSADSVIDGEFDTQGWNRFSYVKGNPIGAKDPTGHLTQLIPIAVRVGQSIAAAGMALCSSGTINCGDMIPSKADKPRDTSVSPNDAKQMEKTGLDPLNAKKGSQKSIGDGGKNGSNDAEKSGVSNKGNNTGNGSGKSDIGSTRSSNKLAPYKDNPGDKIKASGVGHHTSFKRDKDGNIYKYETYGKTKTGHFDPRKRFDGGQPDGTPGKTHTNKITEKVYGTPHVQGKNISGGVRDPRSNELPNNPRF
ncbi:RHS repeat-associated core domain protein [Leptospira kirschneri str. 200801925]|nr:RHS repeat-associated core domain protein [Leptospira kirschneri str. 200801925]